MEGICRVCTEGYRATYPGLLPEDSIEHVISEFLEAITGEMVAQGAREQWVSVQKGNQKGVPFYEARGFTVEGARPAFGGATGTSLRLRRSLVSTSREP